MLQESVCNTIHHLLEYTGSKYIQVSDVLCYKPIPIIYRTSLLQNPLKVIIIENVSDKIKILNGELNKINKSLGKEKKGVAVT